MNAKERYEEWLLKLDADDPLRKQLEEIADDEREIEERFYQNITFGTAGLRGKVGAGTNNMNVYTVGKATQGIAEYIKKHGEVSKGVVIAHDCRHFSKEFSQLTAGILAANGIHAYTFPDLRPTPELSFMIRRLGTVSGINITASHNPKEYNGYKVYWQDGAQVSSGIADGMLEEIEKVDMFAGVKHMDFAEGVEKGLITVLGPEMDRAYLDLVISQSVYSADEIDADIPVVYTPLNGAGSIPVMTVLKERGFTNVHIVEEQKDPDPDFTTVGYPNPEDTRAFALSEKLGRSIGAELLIATDPDSDRLAIEVIDENGNYKPLNGNQTGVLLVNYLLEGKKKAGVLPERGAIVKSIVTADMSRAIAEAYGVRMFETLTGFKNICGKIPWLQKHGYTYILGYEESVGYSPAEPVRDKDGVATAMLMTEAAAFYRKQGKTLLMVLEDLFKQYGYYAEEQVSLILEGLEGQRRIARMMAHVRADLPQEFAGLKVEKVIDFKDGYEDIPASNVLKFMLEKNTWFAMRPSGTEPKLKFYFYTCGTSHEDADATLKALKEEVLGIVNSVA